MLAGKSVPSNCSVAGNPARIISEGIFWLDETVHSWTEKETKQHQVYTQNDAIFQYDNKIYTPFEEIDELFSRKMETPDKLQIIIDFFCEHHDKNRFASKLN